MTAARSIDDADAYLFVPGDDERKLSRALALSETVVVDLEDAVGPARKQTAREVARAALTGDASPEVTVVVRINGVDSPWFEDDLAWLETAPVDGVMLPKAERPGAERVAATGRPVIALVETARGLRDAYDVISTPGVVRLALGAVDLAAELGLEPRPDGAELLTARSDLVRDSAAAGRPGPIDGVWTALGDEAGLRHETRLARTLGMTAKLCIHPRQVAVVRDELRPTPEQLAWARAIAARAEATDEHGVLGDGGEMIDVAVVRRARRILTGGTP
jgi:citrate lyase subunit beta/citryl-CoA lyase